MSSRKELDESNLRHSLNEQDRVARDDTYQKKEVDRRLQGRIQRLANSPKNGTMINNRTYAIINRTYAIIQSRLIIINFRIK